jgi:integrase
MIFSGISVAVAANLESIFPRSGNTYATLNLMAGANPMWVAKQLGHANMPMVLTVYAKWIDGADKSNEPMNSVPIRDNPDAWDEP